jgi:hypothetical protein
MAQPADAVQPDMNKEPPSLFFTTSELVLDISPRGSPIKVYKSEPPLNIVSTSPGQLTATSTPAENPQSFDKDEEAGGDASPATYTQIDHSNVVQPEISAAAEGSPLRQNKTKTGTPAAQPSLLSPVGKADASAFRPAAIASSPSQDLAETRIAAVHLPHVETLQTQLQRLKIENINWQQRAERREDDLQAAQRDGDRWQREAKQWRERCQLAEENCDAMQHRADATAAHVFVLESATASMQERNLSLENSLTELKAAHVAATEEVQRLRDQKESVSSELAVKLEELTTLSREHRRLLVEVGTLKERVGSLTTLVERLASASPSPATAAAAATPAVTAAQIEARASKRGLQQPSSGVREVDGAGECVEGRDAPKRTELRGDEAVRAADACTSPERCAQKKDEKQDATMHQSGSEQDSSSSSSSSSSKRQDVEHVQSPVIAKDRSVHGMQTASMDRSSPFRSARALIQRTAELESSLLALNMERQSLENELNRFPSGSAGRTVAERRKKRAVEERLLEVNKQVSGIKRELRSLGAV